FMFEAVNSGGELARYKRAQSKRARDRQAKDQDRQFVLRLEGKELDKILKADPDLKDATYRWGGKVNISELAKAINVN
ncbi:hypothetical protein M8360_34855, partial [Klebsiella pneumoniae]|nr:hypothetical protein [Klebsiella pneumoniae]